MEIIANQNTRISQLVSFDNWLESIDKTRTTGWKWRKKGVISTLNVFGKLYVTRDEITRFESRVLSGEFAITEKQGAQGRFAKAVSI